MASLWLPFRLPGLNELIDWAGRVSAIKPVARLKGGRLTRARWSRYSDEKQRWEAIIGATANASGFDIPPGAWAFTYFFCEPNLRRDPSNVAAAGIKFIEDALQKCGAMENDNWAVVRSTTTYVRSKKETGISHQGVLLHVGALPLAEFEATHKAQAMARSYKQRERSYGKRIGETEPELDDSGLEDHEPGGDAHPEGGGPSSGG